MATISSLLADHVTLQVRSVDRLFLQGYVPRLQTEGQVIRFLLDRGFPIPSPAVLGKIGRSYVEAINRFVADREIPVVRFVKGDVKEEIAREHFKRAEAEGRFGVVMVGVCQEKTSVWRGWRDGGPDGHPHFVYRRQSVFPNNYYFYIRDPDWGPAFIKTIAYAPFSVWVYLNGNEWAKQQVARDGVEFTPLDNGFASCADERALTGICSRLSAADVWAFFDRWQATLPSPFTVEDRARGYGYDLAFRQLEISDTGTFDRPASGRAWFERTLPDQLTLGRPDQVAVVFGPASPAKPRAGSTPGSSTRACRPRSRSTTAPRRSSSTSKKAARSEPRRPSTTPTTSGSAAASPQRTGTRWSGSDMRSTSDCSTTNLTRANAHQTPRRSSAWCCHPPPMAYPPPDCGSVSGARWRCSPAYAHSSICSPG